ncbi:MAG: hypothetical protein ACOX0X_03255 [Candidatus Dojkabacteria bacterium]
MVKSNPDTKGEIKIVIIIAIVIAMTGSPSNKKGIEHNEAITNPMLFHFFFRRTIRSNTKTVRPIKKTINCFPPMEKSVAKACNIVSRRKKPAVRAEKYKVWSMLAPFF